MRTEGGRKRVFQWLSHQATSCWFPSPRMCTTALLLQPLPMPRLVPDGLRLCKASGICFYVNSAPAARLRPALSSAFPLPGPSMLPAATRQQPFLVASQGQALGLCWLPLPEPSSLETGRRQQRQPGQPTEPQQQGSGIRGPSANGQPRLFLKFIYRNSLTWFQKKFPYQRSVPAIVALYVQPRCTYTTCTHLALGSTKAKPKKSLA